LAEIIPGEVTQLSPLVRRVTAPNAGPLTGPGTNSYIIGKERFTVVDPGPAIDSHIEAILQACENKIDHILVTHTHADHSPAASQLATATGAHLVGAMQHDDHQDKTFQVSRDVKHAEQIGGEGFTLQAVHTPGHVGNHFCYLLEEEGMLFAGDHIMEGSTVVIVPPGGDMAAYINSLKLLENYPIQSIAPGHGGLIEEPMDWVRYLIDHRLQREQKVLKGLEGEGEISLEALTKKVYDDVDESLHLIASVSLWAHLLKLEDEGKVEKKGPEAEFGQQPWSLKL